MSMILLLLMEDLITDVGQAAFQRGSLIGAPFSMPDLWQDFLPKKLSGVSRRVQKFVITF